MSQHKGGTEVGYLNTLSQTKPRPQPVRRPPPPKPGSWDNPIDLDRLRPKKATGSLSRMNDMDIAAAFAGKSVDEVMDDLDDLGLDPELVVNEKKSKLAQMIYLRNNKKGKWNIDAIEFHPGGGVHRGSYWKLSKPGGKVKLVNPDTYNFKGEKNVHYIFVEGL